MQKTAGESFLNHLTPIFPPDSICPYYFEHNLQEGPTPHTWQVFVGHISPGALAEFFPETNLILMLRDPRERLISAYFYWRQHAATVAPTSEFFARIEKMSFLEFLTDKRPDHSQRSVQRTSPTIGRRPIWFFKSHEDEYCRTFVFKRTDFTNGKGYH